MITEMNKEGGMLMSKVSQDEIQQARALFDECIGRAKYQEVAGVLGVSPSGLSNRLKLGTIRVTELLRLCNEYNREITVTKKSS